MEEIMIKIDHVSKQYKLGQIGGTTLRDELQRLSARIHRREDPTRRIGAREYEKGETFMALDGVSFDVKKGERVGIIGHNGAGKSTLLKLISRVTAPTSGVICLNGRVASMLEVGTGFHGELTGRENIYMNGAILGMTKKEIDRKIEDIIDFSECRQFIDTPVKRYSSGMYVKLAFSVAAHLDSEIMIMDEVLAVGDMAFQKKCLEKMNDVSRTQGRTILYVSHNMNTIRQLCDRCVVLDHGKKVFDGSVEEGIGHYVNIHAAAFSQTFDFSNAPHQSFVTRKAVLTKAIWEKQINVFSSEEEIRFDLFINSQFCFQSIRLMFILFYKDGTRIAKTESNDFPVQKGENILQVRLPCAGIADGDYYFEISIVQRLKHDSVEKFDGVSDTMHFTIMNKNVFGIEGAKWKPEYWGHFMLLPALAQPTISRKR